MTGRSPPAAPASSSSSPPASAAMKRPSSPTKRGQIKGSQSLSYRQVNDIIDSCRTNFNSDMESAEANKKQPKPGKKSSVSPRSRSTSERTLRTKTLNSKTGVDKRRSDPVKANNNAKLSLNVVRDILQTYVMPEATKTPSNRLNGLRATRSEVLPPPGASASASSCRSAMVSPAETRRGARSQTKASSAPASPTKTSATSTSSTSSSSKRKLGLSPSGSENHNKRLRLDSEQKRDKSESPVPLKPKKKAAPMDEVMKLHQDEGVMHLLHALPTSRRKIQTTLFSAGGNSSNYAHGSGSSHTPARRSSADSKGSGSGRGGRPQTSSQKPKKNNLIKADMSMIKSVSNDELMNPKTLEMLKKLPKKDYLHLWSSKSRYRLADEAMEACRNTMLLKQSSVSPDSSAGSDISSASTMAAKDRARRIGDRMLINVSNLTKQYKDILIRSYPTFASIILAPTTTGMKNSFNANVMEEIMDALKALAEHEDCLAVMITGLGQVFTQGIDLTQLTHDSVEKQRRAAEALANTIKVFVKSLLAFPKLLVAGVNGLTCGLGVMLLPYFDIVYANDKAVMKADYTKFGQIPEAFGSVSMDKKALQEVLLLSRSMTAEQAMKYGLVSSVMWPGRFMEDIVPRMEELEDLSSYGMQCTKLILKKRLKQQVTEVMEEETKELVRCWTRPDFARDMKSYLRTATDIIFQ